MASISSTATSLYNYTAPVSNANVLNDKKANGESGSSAVNSAKLSAESTIVTLGSKPSESLTYNAMGMLNAADLAKTTQSNSLTSEQAAQNAILQAQTAMSDALNTLSSDSTSNAINDISSLLNIPGVTSAR
ncbi:MAG: hypothetical protein PHP57_05000 [Sideroxydans sp.]|nr:hypothetical protein [Sideroxydans sp.]